MMAAKRKLERRAERRPLWKFCTWDDLDTLTFADGAMLSLSHNKGTHFRKALRVDEDKLSASLVALQDIGKRTAGANPKITGFVKVMEHAHLDGVSLIGLLATLVAGRSSAATAEDDGRSDGKGAPTKACTTPTRPRAAACKRARHSPATQKTKVRASEHGASSSSSSSSSSEVRRPVPAVDDADAETEEDEIANNCGSDGGVGGGDSGQRQRKRRQQQQQQQQQQQPGLQRLHSTVRRCGLERFARPLIEAGVEDVRMLPFLEDTDFTALGMTKLHQRVLLRAAAERTVETESDCDCD